MTDPDRKVAAALQQHLPEALDWLLAVSTSAEAIHSGDDTLISQAVVQLAAIVVADGDAGAAGVGAAAAATALLTQPVRMRALAKAALRVLHEHLRYAWRAATWGLPANSWLAVAEQLLQVLHQVVVAAAAAGRVDPLLAEQLAAEPAEAAGPADEAADAPGPAGAAADVAPSRLSRIVLLLQCLQPLESCRQGLLALVPHLPLLQQAAAELSITPVSEFYMQRQQQASQQWAAQTGDAASAELAKTKSEHATAWRELQCALVGVAEQHAFCRAAAAAAAGEEQQQQEAAQAMPACAGVAAAVEQLAAAQARVVELEQLLQLAGGAE
jgi:hypothetical protein